MDLQKLAETYLETKHNNDLTKLLKQIDPLLNHKAYSLAKLSQEEFEDIKQELCIVVMKKLPTYDSTRAKFSTFLNAIMRGDPTDILANKVCRKRGGNGKNMFMSLKSLDAPLNEEGMTLGDIVPMHKDFREDIYNRDIINQHKHHIDVRKEF